MRSRVRLLGTIYLLAILGASLVSPHRHLNPITDLLFDGPSDSGVFLFAADPSSDGRPALSGFVFVDDDPCLACFWHDFQSVARVRFRLVAPVSVFSMPLCLIEGLPRGGSPREPIIRGPPFSPD